MGSFTSVCQCDSKALCGGRVLCGAAYSDLRILLESPQNLSSHFAGASLSFQGGSKESTCSESQVILLIPRG